MLGLKQRVARAETTGCSGCWVGWWTIAGFVKSGCCSGLLVVFVVSSTVGSSLFGAWFSFVASCRLCCSPCILLSCIVRPSRDGNVWEQKRQQETVAQLGKLWCRIRVAESSECFVFKWYRNLAAVVQITISMQNGHTKGDRPGGGGSWTADWSGWRSWELPSMFVNECRTQSLLNCRKIMQC